jgi:signal transduction histidine kinase
MALFVYGLTHLYRWKDYSDYLNKKQANLLLVGSLVTFVISGITNVFLPLIGFFNFNWFGQVSVIFLIMSTTHAIFNYNFLNIKIVLSKIIKYVVYSIYAYTTFYGLTFLYTKFFGSVTAIEPLVIGVIIAPLFAYFLFKLDYYTDMLNRRLFGELHKHSDVLNEISHFLSRNLVREDILKYIEDVLNNFFGVTNSRVVIGGGGSTLIDWKNEYNYVNQVKQDNGSVISIYLPKRDVNEEYSSMDLDMVQAIGSQLSVALERSDLYEKVSHFAEMLEMEVDKKTAQVQQQKNELSQLLKSKDEILHIINHQLNTPLSIIKSASGMVRDGLWTQDKYFEVTTRESERLGQIIKDFWQAEDTSNFKKSLKKEVVDLTGLVEKIIEEKKLLAKVRVGTVTISEDFKGISFKTFCDSTQITQVISNYLDNAIAYTKQGVVKISLREEGNRIICEITDRGIGFLEASKSKLFEKFVRTDEAKLARPDGSGLGLYICRRIIEAHDGEVWAKSDGLDKGATFGFSLPTTSV